MKNVVVVVLLLALIFVSGSMLVNCQSEYDKEHPPTNTKTTNIEIVNLEVDGMTCNGCVESIQSSVARHVGVKECTVSLENKSAAIAYNPQKTNQDEIVQAITGLGYEVKVKEN